MADFNLEEEFASYLDILDEMLYRMNNPTLEHFGVKGMKWGVRKADAPAKSNPITGLGPDSVTRKTRSGEELTLTKKPPIALAQLIARHSEKYRNSANKNAFLEIKDSSGKKVGECSLTRVSKDEINLVWLGINKKERGKGYASAVMEAGVEFGRQSGAKRLTLEVPGHSPDAAHIYQKLGFKFVNNPKPFHNDPNDTFWGGLYNMELNFSDVKHTGVPVLSDEAILRHYGVRGMKWGVRRDKTPTPAITIEKPGRRVKAKGGQYQPPSEDAITAATLHRTAKKSTTDSLSNKELQALVTRMNLERQFRDLEKEGLRDSQGKQFVKTVIKNGGQDFALKTVEKGASAAIDALPGGKAVKLGVGLTAAIASAYINKTAGKQPSQKKDDKKKEPKK